MIKKLLISILTVLAVVAAGCVLCAGYVVIDNARVKNTEYEYKSEKVPQSFDGYRFTVVSDFHNGNNGDKVLKAVKKAAPDVILITGDYVNDDTTDFTNAIELAKGLTQIAPVYYSYGNHERWSFEYTNLDYPIIKDKLEGTGVVILDDETVQLEKDGETIQLTGYGDEIYGDTTEHYRVYFEKALKAMSKNIDENKLSVLMMHRPQFLDMTVEYPFDLVLAGHTHGGLINIKPIRDYILEEHFGTSEYVKGEYIKGGHHMFVSSGIAKEDNIYRVFNTPEVMTVTLRCE